MIAENAKQIMSSLPPEYKAREFVQNKFKKRIERPGIVPPVPEEAGGTQSGSLVDDEINLLSGVYSQDVNVKEISLEGFISDASGRSSYQFPAKFNLDSGAGKSYVMLTTSTNEFPLSVKPMEESATIKVADGRKITIGGRCNVNIHLISSCKALPVVLFNVELRILPSVESLPAR